MPIDRAFVGREYPAPTPFRVEADHVRRFADAVGDPDPVYRDAEAARAAGHPDVVAPPTFLTVLAFQYALQSPVADPALGLDYTRVVHGEQQFDLHRAVHAGDVLTSTVRVAEVRDVGRNEALTLVTDVTDEAGAPVATCTSVIVSRGTAAPKEAL